MDRQFIALIISYRMIFLEECINIDFLFKGWFTPGQMFVLDEYCARYGVRGCYRHLKYMEDLLEKCEKNVMIDPTLFHVSYAYCASHVHGNR